MRFVKGPVATLDSMASLPVCSAAEVDYLDSLQWYAERSKNAALDFESEIDAAFQAIVSTPDLFPMCDSRYRFYLLKRYPSQVIYRVLPSEVLVIAIAHKSRSNDYRQSR